MSLKTLIVFEHQNGQQAGINAELAAAAASLDGDWAGLVLLGPGQESVVDELARLCPKLYTVISDHLSPMNPLTWIEAIKNVVAQVEPTLIMIAHNPFGLDVAPAMAQNLSAPLATDIIDLKQSGQAFKVTRPVYGGKLAASLTLSPQPVAVVTMRPGSFEPEESEKPGSVVALDGGQGPESLARRFVELIPASGGVDLTAAKIIVSVGRGIEGPENIEVAQELADALGAELGCSRPVADLGWLSKDRQVGISGQTVKPVIYIALGISGAFQHQAGMGGSETIIAVNRDADAPIFDIAAYGVVGDLFDVVPALVDVLSDS